MLSWPLETDFVNVSVRQCLAFFDEQLLGAWLIRAHVREETLHLVSMFLTTVDVMDMDRESSRTSGVPVS